MPPPRFLRAQFVIQIPDVIPSDSDAFDYADTLMDVLMTVSDAMSQETSIIWHLATEDGSRIHDPRPLAKPPEEWH